jgi:hypothetical protein
MPTLPTRAPTPTFTRLSIKKSNSPSGYTEKVTPFSAKINELPLRNVFTAISLLTVAACVLEAPNTNAAIKSTNFFITV